MKLLAVATWSAWIACKVNKAGAIRVGGGCKEPPFVAVTSTSIFCQVGRLVKARVGGAFLGGFQNATRRVY